MVTLFQDARQGNHGRDAADLFSAVTDYYTHESSSGEDKQRQFVSSEYGAGLQRKQDFFAVLQDGERLKKVYARGLELCAN